MEGDVGRPPAVRASSTLWEGVQSLDGNKSAISTYLKGDLAKDIVLVTKMAEAPLAVAKKAKLGLDNLNFLMGQNTVVVLKAKVRALEGHINTSTTL